MSDCDKLYKWAYGLKTIYQPLKGFEEKTAPERVRGFEEILKNITRHCGDVTGRRFLDIGANVGYFCFQLTDMGAETIAVERDTRRSQLSQCVATQYGYNDNPRFVNAAANKWIQDNKPRVDYVIWINTIHHMFVQDEQATWDTFNWLIENTNGVFIMMRNSLKDWRLCDSASEIPEAVINCSSASKYVAYQRVHGRVIYFFSK